MFPPNTWKTASSLRARQAALPLCPHNSSQARLSRWCGAGRGAQGQSQLDLGWIGASPNSALESWASNSDAQFPHWKMGVKTINSSVSFQDEMTSPLPSTVPGMGRCSVNMSALPPTSWFLGSWSQFDHHCQEFSSAVRLTPPLSASLSPCVRTVKWQAPLCLFYVLSHKIQLLLCPQSPRHMLTVIQQSTPPQSTSPGKDWSPKTVRLNTQPLCLYS